MAKKGRPTGALRFEVPYTSEQPKLTSAAVGLPRLLHRPGASYEMAVSILDAPDGRLLRAGVVVAHRVIRGGGEWYLSAPGWEPHLPAERVEQMAGNGDLPRDFARLLGPFVRGAVLSPIAILTSTRDEWALRTDGGETAAIVRDEKVEVHRDRAVVSRYREVTVEPTDHLTGQQREFLLSAAQAVQATVVERFPTIQQRIGSPATGLTSFPVARPLRRDATLEEFVATLFARHLGDIVRADLDRRTGDTEDVGLLNDRLWAFGRDLRGLAPVLEPGWRSSVEHLLRGLPFETSHDIEQPTMDVIDALIVGARAPRLGDLSQWPAAQVLFERAEQGTVILADRCRSLSVTGADEAWQAALMAAQQLEVAASVLAPLMPKVMGKLLRKLDDVLDELRHASHGTHPGAPDLDGLSPTQAYQLGLDYERARSETVFRRHSFVHQWPGRAAEARKLIAKAKKKQDKYARKQRA